MGDVIEQCWENASASPIPSYPPPRKEEAHTGVPLGTLRLCLLEVLKSPLDLPHPTLKVLCPPPSSPRSLEG